MSERQPGPLRHLAELLAMTGFAIAQPMLDITGRAPDFFLYRRLRTGDMRLFVALVVFALPFALWAVETAVYALHKVAGRVLHLLFLAALFGVIVVQMGKRADLVRGIPLALVAALTGLGLVVLLVRAPKFRQAVFYAAPAPLVFLLVFALTSPSGALLKTAKRGAAAASATGETKPPVVVIFFDELPLRALLDEHGKVDARLYPHFAELAGTSTWYSNITAVTGYTPFAVPAMLTGRYPRKALAPSEVEYPNNLFTLLRDLYDVQASESITALCPPSVCAALPPGRDTGFGAIVKDALGVAKEIVSPYRAPARQGGEFAEQPALGVAPPKGRQGVQFKFAEGAKNQPERLTTFLDGIGRVVDKPTLDFLHILLPHVPFRYTPTGVEYRTEPSKFPMSRNKETDDFRMNEELGATIIQQQRMMLQLTYTDLLLGAIMARMRATKLWDDALFVVTADHGEGFTPNENVRHYDDTNMAELCYVPLFVKAPKQRTPAVNDREAMHVDLLPTIADMLDVTMPFKVDGVSMLGPERQTTERRWYDVPGTNRPFDGKDWRPRLAKGLAADIAHPERGPRGLYALKPMDAWYGKKLDAVTVGAPLPVVATPGRGKTFDEAKPSEGTAQTLLWGGLDRAPADGSTWLVASVNGTIAGTVLAARSRVAGTWHFVGMLDDAYFKDGKNDIRLYAVSGTTLRPIEWKKS